MPATLRRSMCALIAWAALSICAPPPPAAAYTPESEEVVKMIDAGLEFLGQADSHRWGGASLAAMALVFDGADESHPKVALAVRRAQKVCAEPPEEINDDLYSTGLGIIFLTELDAEKYRSEIVTLLRSLEIRQKENGGWGYPLKSPHGATSDTSMTQYAVLSHWIAKQAGIPIRDEAVEAVLDWLLRTQDPSGAWGYQGVDPGIGNYQRVPQKEIRHSLCAAGLGSVYIAADILNLNETGAAVDPDLPEVFKLVVEQNRPKGERGPLDPRRVAAAQIEGNRWFKENYRIDTDRWTYYYMYALERYQTFREKAEGRSEKEPKWYNDGVELLKSNQRANGGWLGQGGAVPDTAFAVLFLMRSTRKIVDQVAEESGEGVLVGGLGLQSDTRHMRFRRGQLVAPPPSGSATELIDLLDNPDDDRFDALIDSPAALILSGDPTQRQQQTIRLKRIISSGTYQARIVAVRALARARSLDNVPTLIYALSDPDWRVVRQARDGLRFTSRKFEGLGLPDQPSEAQRRAAIRDWKQWYLQIRPTAEFLE